MLSTICKTWQLIKSGQTITLLHYNKIWLCIVPFLVDTVDNGVEGGETNGTESTKEHNTIKPV